MKFEYTEEVAFKGSSVIEGIYFNENTSEVALDIKDMIYVYSNVKREGVNELAGAKSVGQEYRNFQEKYGPGILLGHYDDIDWMEIPKNGQFIVNSGNSKFVITSDSASITTGTVNSAIFTTYPPKRHTVEYSIEGLEGIKDYTFTVQSVQEAIKSVKEIGQMMGLEIKVKGVYVHINE